MSRRGSIERLFQAFGTKADGTRGSIYVERVAQWPDIVVAAAVTRTIDRWPHASLPPLGKLVQACIEVAGEDAKHRGARQDAASPLRSRRPRFCRRVGTCATECSLSASRSRSSARSQ